MGVSGGNKLYVFSVPGFCSLAEGHSDPQLDKAFPYLSKGGVEVTQARGPEDAGINVLCRVLQANGGQVTGAYVSAMRKILKGFGDEQRRFLTEYENVSGPPGKEPEGVAGSSLEQPEQLSLW
jgi:hypothetical protein